MSGIKVQGSASGAGNFTVTPPNGGASDRTLTLPDRTASLASDGPSFSAYQSVAQTITNNGVDQKVTLTTEEFDTASCYDTTTSRFTPNVPGYYFVHGCVSGAFSGNTYVNSTIKKGGTTVAFSSVFAGSGPYTGIAVGKLLYMNGTTDYVELYFTCSGGTSNNTTTGASQTWFQAHMVRAA